MAESSPPTEDRADAADVAAVAGAIGAVGGGVTAVGGPVAGAAAAVGLAKLMVRLARALRRLRKIVRWALRRKYGSPSGEDTPELVAALAEEERFAEEYRRRATARIRHAARREGGPVERARRLDGAIRREAHFGRLHARASLARAGAAADRDRLMRVSPFGATWRLGQRATHTPDCLLLAGHALPWEALLLFPPPTHPGCGCTLEALRKKPGQFAPSVMSVRAGVALVRRAMVMHAAEGLEEAADMGDEGALDMLMERAGLCRMRGAV